MAANLIRSIYTDGACSGNPGPGGWGTVVYFVDGSVYELGGGERETTNNRMEMQAAIGALEFLVSIAQSRTIATEIITLYTDSEYVKNGVTKWIAGWKKKGWKTAAGKPVLNQDLWETLDQLNIQTKKAIASLNWEYVKGHAGVEGNERCDTIARSFSMGRKPNLRRRSLDQLDQIKVDQLEVDQLEVQPARADVLQQEIQSAQQQLDLAPELEAEEQPKKSAKSSKLKQSQAATHSDQPMNSSSQADTLRVQPLRELLEVFKIADEIAKAGYLISSAELAMLMNVPLEVIESQGDRWIWRNWKISRARQDGEQVLWQLTQT
jgi:ribonuclease HI